MRRDVAGGSVTRLLGLAADQHRPFDPGFARREAECHSAAGCQPAPQHTRLSLIFLLALPLSAQMVDRAVAWFPDGTGLEIYTESTGATRPSPMGAIGIGPGPGKKDLVNRIVVDSGTNILFGYHLEAFHGARPGTVDIRVLPLSTAMESVIAYDQKRDPSRPKFSGDHIATVAAVREFSSVGMGQVVTLDILYNRATGEKIYDVIRPLSGPSPGVMQVTSGKSRQEISLRDIAVTVNNKPVKALVSWMMGAAMRIDIPGHGAFVVSVTEPHVPPIYAFQAVAHADGNHLTWKVDGVTVRIDSNAGILTHPDSAPLWLYHDPRYRPDSVRVQTADTADWLIPKRY